MNLDLIKIISALILFALMILLHKKESWLHDYNKSSFLFPFAISFILFFLLWNEVGSISLSFAISVLAYILGYLTIEWVCFKKELSGESWNIAQSLNNMNSSLTTINEINNRTIESLNEINGKLKSVSRIGSMLDKFSDIDMLINAVIDSLEADIKFDNAIKQDQQSQVFHLYLSELKYKQFFKHHFVFSDTKKCISKIPKYYFETYIWNKLIDESDCYHSLQVISESELDETKKIYVRDSNRLINELNMLIRQIKQGKLRCFQKIFVLDDNLVDFQNKKINNKNIKKYLEQWSDKFINANGSLLKLTTNSKAIGAIENNKLDDIGIFGDILGIQSVVNNQSDLIFEFVFDSKRVTRYKENYKSIFEDAINISDFMQ